MFKTFGPLLPTRWRGRAVEPDETYDGDRTVLDLGGRTVELLNRGLAHTRGDQVVWLPDERILFTGDLVESRIFPIYPFFPPTMQRERQPLDRGLRWLEELGPRQVVPGHGEVSD